jgi:hypothetical protein
MTGSRLVVKMIKHKDQISLLMSLVLKHRPSLWITHKNGYTIPCGSSADWGCGLLQMLPGPTA